MVKRTWVVGAAVGILFWISSLAFAGPPAVLVGSVVDIDGPSLATSKQTENRWFAAYPTMKTYLNEKLRCDDSTSASLEFLVGGRAVLAPGSEVEVTSRKDVTLLKISRGSIWAKFDKQEKALQIQTAGGVLGIEGTEFVVDVDDTGETAVDVIEGAVKVTAVDGQSEVLNGGERVRLGRRLFRRERFAARSSDEAFVRSQSLKRARRKKFGPLVERNLLRPRPRYKQARYLSSDYQRLTDSLNDPSLYQKKGREARRPLLKSRWESPNPNVSAITATNPGPRLSWNPIPGAASYAVAVTEESSGKGLVWRTMIKDTHLAYPKNGPELDQGREYFVFVLGLKDDGRPIADLPPLTGSFSAHAHLPEYSVIGAPATNADSGLPSFKWERVPRASGYFLTLLNADEETVWVGESDQPTYSYPVDARSLPPGRYSVQLEAYDSSGLTVARSRPSLFEIGSP